MGLEFRTLLRFCQGMFVMAVCYLPGSKNIHNKETFHVFNGPFIKILKAILKYRMILRTSWPCCPQEFAHNSREGMFLTLVSNRSVQGESSLHPTFLVTDWGLFKLDLSKSNIAS